MTDKPTVGLYSRYSNRGAYIGKATFVTLPGERCVRFTERLPKGHAVEQAMRVIEREKAAGRLES